MARLILVQSVSTRRPVRSFCESTSASLDRIRCVSLGVAHLQREDQHWASSGLGDMGGNTEAEAGLAHCRPSADDVESRGLQARQDLVEIVETRRGSGDDVAAFERLLQLVHRQWQQVAERHRRVDDACLGDLEDLRLCLVECLGDIVGLEITDLGDLAGDADELAQHRRVLHDLGVPRRVGDGRRRVLQLEQRLRPTDLVEQSVATQFVGDSDGVDGLTIGHQPADGRVDVLMRRLVEVIDPDAELTDLIDDIAQQTPSSLLGIELCGGTHCPTGEFRSRPESREISHESLTLHDRACGT
jgi:hypothetical protein